MTINHTNNFVLDQVLAVHDFSADTIKLALYGPAANITSATESYTASGEVTNEGGYTSGGQVLSLVSSYPKIENGDGAARFMPVVWVFTNSRLIRYALMYNASKSNKAILMIDFGASRSYKDSFTVDFPLAASPIIRFSTRGAA